MHIIHRSTIFFAILNIALLAILAKSIHAWEEQRVRETKIRFYIGDYLMLFFSLNILDN